MGLFIPNLNLPKGCGDCLFTKRDVNGYYWCVIDPSILVDGLHEYTRHADCPLQELDSREIYSLCYERIFKEDDIMLESIKKGFGLTVGVTIAYGVISVLAEDICKYHANNEDYMERLKTRDPKCYEELKEKYQNVKED